MDDPYRIIRQIGHSPWCTIFLAEQRTPNRAVILKMLNGHVTCDPSKAHNFNEQAEELKRLSHPHIASLLDYGVNNYGQPYLAFEHVRGPTLNDYQLQQGAISTPTALEISKQIAEALSAAHAAGIVHRDLRPQSIILASDAGDAIDLKVFDFSFAKLLSVDELSFDALTANGMLLGPPMYMSPEQCLGERVDARADIYSLGCILYELLSGQTPFQDASGPSQTVHSHLHRQPVAVNELRPDNKISRDLDALVMRLLRKSPAERYQSAPALLAALNNIGSVSRRTVTTPARVILAVVLFVAFGLAWCLRDRQTDATRSAALLDTGQSKSALGNSVVAGEPEQANQLSPQESGLRAQAYCEQAAASFRAGRLDQAVTDYTLALQVQPSMMAAYEGRALVFLKLGKTRQAIADCTAYVQQHSDDAAAFYCLGRLYKSVGDEAQAADCLSKSLQLAPDAAAYCDRGLLYLHLLQPRLASQDLAAIDALTVGSKQSKRSLASCRALLAGALDVYAGKHRSALPLLTSVVKANPTWKEAYSLRAVCYDKLGQPALARSDRSIAAKLTDLSDLEVGG